MPEPAAAPPAREAVGDTVLGFDFGLRRIGVAVGTRALRQAHPLETIDAAGDEARFARIDALIREWAPARLVVGLPRHADGGAHALAPACAGFARCLAARYRLTVDFADETLSSATGSARLREAGGKLRRDKARIDALAAQAILETWFDVAA
jgi:putative Holliday junction resolvase